MITSDDAQPRIDPPTAAEREWIDIHLDAAVEAGVDIRSLDDIGELYDVELSAWLQEGGDPNPAINIVGLALGEHLSRVCDLTWVVATDEGGPEVALHRPLNGVLVYPLGIIARQWEARNIGIVPGLVRELVETLGSLPDD